MSEATGTREAEEGGDAVVPGVPGDPGDPGDLRQALDRAFDYRGDVTITTRSGESIVGFVFDRRRGNGLGDSIVRIIPTGSDERRSVAYDQIADVAFTGRDTAAGKSFERWVRKYVEKKLAGEAANIEAEPLEEGAGD